MFYIVESEKQLKRLEDLSYLEECYVEVVTGNDNFHPALTDVVAVYIRPFEEEVDKETQEVVGWKHGYIIPVDHNEGLCVSLERVQDIVKNYKTVYVLDRKTTLYFLNHSNFVDINLLWSMVDYSRLEYYVREKTYNWFYNRYGGREDVNKVIPLAKIYERCESTFDQVENAISDYKHVPGFYFFNTIATNLFYLIEKEGIRVDVHEFLERFHPTNPDFSIRGETVYTRYNLYNTTGRPTNSFNAVNFLAIPKGEEFRRCFKPKNDEFVQMDFDGYHVRLVANLLGYDIPLDEKAHMFLAKQYFGKKVTKEQYRQAKQVNFQAIYGTIPFEYEYLPFFKKLKVWIEDLWQRYEKEGKISVPISEKEFTKVLSSEMRPTKLMNYLVQSYETARNVTALYNVLKMLRTCETKLLLVTYDSILLDFSKKDGKELLTKIKDTLECGKFPVSVDFSKDLNFS